MNEGELERALGSGAPSAYFQGLRQAGLLEAAYPEVHRLIGKSQPWKYHPEGDAYEHTMLVLDRVAKAGVSITARFAALAHDLGKGTTPPEMLPHHYGHEGRGLIALHEWDARAGLPPRWRAAAETVIREHMRAWKIAKAGKVVDLLMAIVAGGAITVREFAEVVRADGNDGKGALPPYLERGEELVELLLAAGSGPGARDRQCEACKRWLLEGHGEGATEAVKGESDDNAGQLGEAKRRLPGLRVAQARPDARHTLAALEHCPGLAGLPCRDPGGMPGGHA